MNHNYWIPLLSPRPPTIAHTKAQQSAPPLEEERALETLNLLYLAPLEQTAIAELMTTRIRVALLTALAQTDGTLGRRRTAATFRRATIAPTDLPGAVVQLFGRRGTVQHIQQGTRRRSGRGQQNLRRRRTVYHLHVFHCYYSTHSLNHPKIRRKSPLKKNPPHFFTILLLLRH